MTGSSFRIEPLGRRHDRAAFSCGIEELDRYFQQQASQDMRRKVAAVSVLTSAEGSEVIGYCTLSATAVEPDKLPAELMRRLPRYPSLPAILLGRLAVDQEPQGQRFGEALLLDAFRRALTASARIAALAVIVDARDDAAVRFYERDDFLRLSASPSRLFIPMATMMATIALLVERAG